MRVVRALTSNQCGPGSNPGVDAMYGSVKFVIGFLLCSQVFRRVLRFSPLLTNNLQSQGKEPWDEVVLNSNSTRNQESTEPLSTRY